MTPAGEAHICVFSVGVFSLESARLIARLPVQSHVTSLCSALRIRQYTSDLNLQCVRLSGATAGLHTCSGVQHLQALAAVPPRPTPTAACSAARREPAPPASLATSACEADLLIIDATNLACIAAADRAYLKPLGTGARANLHAVFADWLRFLGRIVQAQHAVAVFDEPAVRSIAGCGNPTAVQGNTAAAAAARAP